MGDAGALVTNDAALADRLRALREHGQQRKYEHDVVGWTSRLDTIQAAVLLRKLEYLDEWNDQRRRIADLYSEALAGVGDLVLPNVSDRGQVWHLYVVRTEDPARSRHAPGRAGHWNRPTLPGTASHLSKAYAHLGLSPRARFQSPSALRARPSRSRCSPA